MTQRRLPWLLGLMTVLLVLRAMDLLRPPAAQPPLAQALPRPPAPVVAVSRPVAPSVAEVDEPLDAFVVRRPPVPATPVAPPAPLAPEPKPFVGPPTPPEPAPPAPPPFQVIGTWTDDKGPSVFVAGPAGTRQARPNEVLFAQYRVEQITPTRLVLRQLSSNQDFQLPVPQVAGTTTR